MRDPWLFSRRIDLAVFGGSAALAMALLAAGKATGDLAGDAPLWVFVAGVVCVDVAHVWATGYRLAADPAELAARRGLYLGLVLFAWAGGVAAHAVSPLLFWRLLAYLAVFHFVRQQYGWVALYRRKNGEGAEGRGLDAAVIYAATLAPLVFWHARADRRFHWFVSGDFALGLPGAAGPLALAVLAALLAGYAVKEVSRARRRLPLSAGKSLVVATTALTWTLGIVVLNSDYAFTVTNVFVHGIPYLALVFFTSRRAKGPAPRLVDRALASPALFLIPLLAAAFLEEWGWDRLVWHENGLLFPGPAFHPSAAALSFLVPLLALPQAAHYLLDGFLWKVAPANREALSAIGLGAVPDTPV